MFALTLSNIVGEIHESPAQGSLVQRGLARSDWGIVNPCTCFIQNKSINTMKNTNQKPSPRSAFSWAIALIWLLFAAAHAVTTTAVHDEKPRNDIADITATATHQEKDEDVVIATTTATICSTICKEVVHYVTPPKKIFGLLLM